MTKKSRSRENWEEILTRVPITSLRAVRSTCTSWNDLTKGLIVGERAAAARQEYMGFMTMDFKVFSLRFCLSRKEKDEEEDTLPPFDLSIKQVDLLNQVEIATVFHCDGLLLCVAKDKSRLGLWNPYLSETRWIEPSADGRRLANYSLGYDIHRNHKILGFVDHFLGKVHRYEIYDLKSDSWRVLVLDATLDWDIDTQNRGVSLKGNTYFFARENPLGPGFKGEVLRDGKGNINIDVDYVEDFLLCFDFTRENFGPRLPLPFHSNIDDPVTISCVRGGDKLAVLYQEDGLMSYPDSNRVEIWVTSNIDPNSVSWIKFLKVELSPFGLGGVRFDNGRGGSFVIDEEEKLAVVFEVDGYVPTESPRYHTAFIFGEDGYYKAVSLGVAPYSSPPPRSGFFPQFYCPPFLCSPYLPSLVRLHQPSSSNKKDE